MANLAGLCLCGCGEKTWIANKNRRRFGWVKGQPVNYVMNHDKTKWRGRYAIDEITGCWNWTGPTTKKGYAAVQGTLGHIFFYKMLVGDVPEGFTIDHTCRNRKCVNVAHLEAVPHIVNCHRGSQTKLTDDQVGEIRERPYSGVGHNDRLGEEFSVSSAFISAIRRGRARTVKEPEFESRFQSDGVPSTT